MFDVNIISNSKAAFLIYIALLPHGSLINVQVKYMLCA